MDDANLAKLSVKQFTINPTFQKTITDYNLTVPSSIDSIEIEATTSDTSASYFLKYKEKDGNKCSIKEGSNKIIIEVSSEDGTIKLYNIICLRLSASDAFLSWLSIAGVQVEPSFVKDIFEYNSVVPYFIINALVNVEVNDPKCEIKLVYSGKEQLKSNGVNLSIDFNYGRTVFEILVKSPDGTKTQPRFIKFKNQNDSIVYEDPISLSPFFCATKLKGLENVYSEPFIEYFYSQTKQDFLTGTFPSDTNEWKEYDLDLETNLSKCEVIVAMINGENSDTKKLCEIGGLIQDLGKSDQLKTQSPVQFILEYDANLNDLSHKFEVKRPWEKTLMKIYDETDPKKLKEMSDKHLQAYFNAMDTHVPYKKYEKDNSPLDFLNLSIYNCVAAVNYKNQDHELHFRLAMLLEEKHHIEDVYGFKNEEEAAANTDDFSFTSNKKAKEGSREEEIDAICKLRNVPPTGSMEQKLKALDEEYHNLLQSGQTHKAEQVQILYHFKVQQTKMDASSSSKACDNQNALGQAYIKYLDALHLSESIKITKYLYHFHAGRMHCLRSNFLLAIKHFTQCLQWNNDDYSNLVKFYLGFALSNEKTVIKARHEEAAYYLCHGLQIFLTKIDSGKQKEKLYAERLFSLTNPAFLQAFVNLANISITYKISKFNFISSKDALQNCAWLCCQTLNHISLNCVDSIKNLIKTSESVKQINWILIKSHSTLLDTLNSSLASSGKAGTKKLLEKRCFCLSSLLRNTNKDNNLEILNLQEKISQKLVLLNPCDNYFLYLLANAQLEKFDSEAMTNKNENVKDLLEECKNTLLASIELEGKFATGEPIPLIAQQKWWIEITTKKEEKQEEVVQEKKPTEASTPAKATTKPAATKPVSKPAPASKAPAKPVTPAKPPTNAKQAANEPACKHDTKKGPVKPAETAKPVEAPVPATPPTTTREVAKPASAKDAKEDPPKMNKKISSSRLLLARVYSRLEDIENSKKYYNQVIEAEPNSHDAYIELADMLKLKGDQLGAVDVYTKFKIDYANPTFDDAYIFGEIVSVLMKNEKFDDQRLPKYMILWAKVLGIGVCEKYIKKLDEKNKTKICKEIYCGVNNKKIDDPELQNFFKFRGWV